MTSRISREAALAAGFAAAFTALTLYVRFVGVIPGDRWALEQALRQATSEDLSNAYQFFTGLGSPYLAIVTVLVATSIVAYNVGASAGALVVLAAAVAGIERIVTELVGATEAAVELSWPADGYPSGHVAYATATFGYLGWLGARHRRREVVLVCAALVAGMMFSRMADRAHLLDEVLGGFLLGAAWVAALVAAVGHSSNRRPKGH